MRGSTGMTGGALQPGIINLANNSNTDVSLVPSTGYIANNASLTALGTSLFSHGTTGTGNGRNVITVNMSAIDKPGATSSYYAVRVTTDLPASNTIYGNIKITALLLNQ